MIEPQTRIMVQVQPNARQNQIVRHSDGVWHLRIAARPVRGKANEELLGFLSEVLGISKARLTLEKGLTMKRKVIAITGLSPSQVDSRLGARLGE